MAGSQAREEVRGNSDHRMVTAQWIGGDARSASHQSISCSTRPAVKAMKPDVHKSIETRSCQQIAPRIIVRSARIRDCLLSWRMDIRRVFGANVRRYRLAARLSQEAVAVRMGVDRAHVSAIERGLQNATLLTILQAAQALRGATRRPA